MLGGITKLNATTAKTGATATIETCVVLTSHQAYHSQDKSGLYKATQDKGGSFSAK